MAKITIKISLEGEINLDAFNEGKGFTGRSCEKSEKLNLLLKLLEKDGEIDETVLKYEQAEQNQQNINLIELI